MTDISSGPAVGNAEPDDDVVDYPGRRGVQK